MAILAMLKLQVIVPSIHKERLLQRLMVLGCVEINEASPPDPELLGEHWLQSDALVSTETTAQLNGIQSAMALIDRFATSKRSGLFPMPRFVDPKSLDDPEFIQNTLNIAHEINKLKETLDFNGAEEERLLTQRLSLLPWVNSDIPLEVTGSQKTLLLHGMFSSTTDFATLTDKLSTLVPEAHVSIHSSDNEQHYLTLLIHKKDQRLIENLLKSNGFTAKHFKQLFGTASENIEKLDEQLKVLTLNRRHTEKKISGYHSNLDDLEMCYDALSLKAHRNGMTANFLKSSRTFYFEGWLPQNKENDVSNLLAELGCAYHFERPGDEDIPPVAYRHSKVVAPFGFIASLYGTPQYGSVIDPTPFMAPFFFIFFGMMMSDAAYGIIMSLVAIWILRQVKQEGFMRQLFTLVLYCGISTILWGVLFGSWFGDLLPAVTKMFTGTPIYVTPLWFDPLKQPMTMLYFSFALGGLQVIVGLGLSGWRQIVLGKWWNAIFDVGFWYMILFGLIFGLFQIPYGFEVAGAGAVGVILTAGRHEKSFLKRIITGVLSLYSITGYLSDVLSYSRLLALGLASGVIASVINAMGTIGGPSVGGVIALVLIFTFGHLFNLAINLVGAYVHASRLQYVEFFSKFYEGGGRPFDPFQVKTKYITLDSQAKQETQPIKTT